MCSEHIQGDEWGTYVTLVRSAPPERGMAYGVRALGSRSARSSRRWGEPTPWRRGTGDRMARTCKVREMRRANAELTVVRGNPEKVTGELREIERLTSSSEGGCGKRAEGYLAGSLPYGTPGVAAETGGAIPSSTVTGRGTSGAAWRGGPIKGAWWSCPPPLSGSVDMTSAVQGCSKFLYFHHRCPVLHAVHRQRRSQSETTVDHADIRGLATTA
jgi:hypothetical protein